MRKFATIVVALSALFLGAGVGEAKQRLRHAYISAPRDDGYFSDVIGGPDGAKTQIRDYPGSATVITRKMMDDIQARSVCDALRLAPGVLVSGC